MSLCKDRHSGFSPKRLAEKSLSSHFGNATTSRRSSKRRRGKRDSHSFSLVRSLILYIRETGKLQSSFLSFFLPRPDLNDDPNLFCVRHVLCTLQPNVCLFPASAVSRDTLVRLCEECTQLLLEECGWLPFAAPLLHTSTFEPGSQTVQKSHKANSSGGGEEWRRRWEKRGREGPGLGKDSTTCLGRKQKRLMHT